MPPTRVLVVGNNILIRRMISDMLTTLPSIEVVGSSPTGEIAIARIPQVNPDLVLMDINMPGTGGLEALRHMRSLWPKMPLFVLNSSITTGSPETVRALRMGATAALDTPEGSASKRAEWSLRLLSLVERHGRRRPRRPSYNCTSYEVLVLGSSTGGPAALQVILGGLPASFPVPILLVQHLPRNFTHNLVERLDAACALTVQVGRSGLIAEPGTVSVAPGGVHMIADRRRGAVVLKTRDTPPENSCKPAVDVLFRSVAGAFGPAVAAAVLTGMGQDGRRGAEEIRAAGGWVVAQDEASSVVWGMPGAVVRANAADKVLALNQLGPALQRQVRRRPRPLKCADPAQRSSAPRG